MIRYAQLNFITGHYRVSECFKKITVSQDVTSHTAEALNSYFVKRKRKKLKFPKVNKYLKSLLTACDE